MSNIPKTLIVHGGIFHADDVLCAAMMKEVNPDIEIKRVFRVPENIPETTIVADIGEGKYDHHQKNAELRPDGNKHAACGLVLRDFENELFPNGVPKAFQEEIEKIEDADNGVEIPEKSILSEVVSYSNPEWDENKTPDEAFGNIVSFVQANFLEPYMEKGALSKEEAELLQNTHEEKMQNRQAAKERAHELLQAAIEEREQPREFNLDKRVIVLPKFAPWQEEVCATDAQFIIYPSLRGGYNIQCVPPTPDSFDKRYPLPKEWLEHKPEGCGFVHQGRFLAQFDTKENAIKATNDLMKEFNYAFDIVKNNPDLLEGSQEEFRHNKEIVLAAVKQDGRTLEYASKELRNDKEVVLAAIKNNPTAFEYASKELRDDKEVVLAAGKQNSYTLTHAKTIDNIINDAKDAVNIEKANKTNSSKPGNDDVGDGRG